MQGETLLPIDIQTNKLLDWLISRRHCSKNWQSNALLVREKINAAIQDMPEVEEMTSLLAGTYINYFHCKRIVEILKETEASSKNIFGRYSSQRMKEWQEIVRMYEKDNMYLAEAAQMLMRTVNYEVPALKRQIAKCQQVQEEATKKDVDYAKHGQELRERYLRECQQLGIPGECIKKELLSLLDDLPGVFEDVVQRLKGCEKAVHFYELFLEFTLGRERIEKLPALPLTSFLMEHGNVTTYQWKYGEAPEVVEETLPLVPVDLDNGNGDQIDFGDVTSISSGNGGSPNGEFVHVDFGEDHEAVVVQEEEIQWDISVEADGITLEDAPTDDGAGSSADGAKVARGADALSLLHNPETRTTFLNELNELECFLRQRLSELQLEGDVLGASIAQTAPGEVQLQTGDRVAAMLDQVRSVLTTLASRKMQHLYQLHSSPRYVDRLVSSLQQLLYQADKMEQSRQAVLQRAQEAAQEQRQLEPKRDLIISKTRLLQKQIEEDISKRYKDRPVNIVGGVMVM